ncbi:MAG: phosphatase [Oscillospiraceae bacterium]|nr:phosphatase [Oscillospiraceae bacterium]
MICGVVDLGSNTVRLSIYRCEGRAYQRLMNRKVMAGLASYVEDGSLSRQGVEIVCRTLLNYRSLLDNLNIRDMYVFATASLRNVDNTKEVVKAVKKETGIQVDVLSGREEGLLAFRGAMQDLHRSSGLMVDIGGGSTELVEFENKMVSSAKSMPVGSLTMFNRFVEGLFPTEKEREAIRGEVSRQFEKEKCDPGSASTVCGVGGTARAACNLANFVFDRPETCKTMTMGELHKLMKRFQDMDRKELNILLKVVPDRIHTILPGMEILDTICRECGAQKIMISTYGVREGYLHEKILRVESEYGEK